MKKLIVLCALVMSSFGYAQADTYNGTDEEGNHCALKIENEKVIIITSRYHAIASSVEKNDRRIVYRSVQLDPRLNVTVRFTDRVEVELDSQKPIQFIASRKAQAKQNTWYGFYMDTNSYGGNQEVRCLID